MPQRLSLVQGVLHQNPLTIEMLVTLTHTQFEKIEDSFFDAKKLSFQKHIIYLSRTYNT